MQPQEVLFFHNRRDHEGSDYFEWYRCYDQNQQVLFSARAFRFGKPISIFKGEDTKQPIAELRNSKGYLVNGKSRIQDIQNGSFLGCYVRTGKVLDGADNTIGHWRDARSWKEEIKGNLIEGLANALLGSGDVPSGANPSDTHLFSQGKEIFATLQREQLPFFPDPPKSTKPGKLAKLASKVVPGKLGKSLGEVAPPVGWTLRIQKKLVNEKEIKLMYYAAFFRLEFLRWSKA